MAMTNVRYLGKQYSQQFGGDIYNPCTLVILFPPILMTFQSKKRYLTIWVKWQVGI